MAILKEINCDFDITVSYWAVDELNINWASKQAHAALFGYRSEDAKKKVGERQVKTYSYDFNETNFPFTKGGDNEEEFYTWLKTEVERKPNEGEIKPVEITNFEGADWSQK